VVEQTMAWAAVAVAAVLLAGVERGGAGEAAFTALAVVVAVAMTAGFFVMH
jgi:hypothetical protein